MKNKHAIHDDFQPLRWVNFSMNPLFIRLINSLLAFSRRFSKAEACIHRQGKTFVTADKQVVRVQLCRPEYAGNKAPVILYFHGGAYVFTYTSLHLKTLENYAKETGAVAVLVEYPLALSQPYPTAFNHCFETLLWLKKHAIELGIDDERIVLMGDSAGGGLVAAVAQKARDNNIRLKGQLMIYPVLDHRCETKTAVEYTDVPVWNTEANRKMWSYYLKNIQGDVPSHASPALGRLEDLPETYIETAEFDPLHDEGQLYAERLKAAGVPVTVNATCGTVHGYDMVASSEISRRAVSARLCFLKALFDKSKS